jgi:hydroxymethylglutaryl-CoA lyase
METGVRLIECPRDAMQGWKAFIPTEKKIEYLNSLLKVGFDTIDLIQNLCLKTGKQLVIYISMGFGNPYGDRYSEEIVFEWVNRLVAMDIGIVSLADTVGVATPEQVYDMTEYLIESLPGIEIGVHLHSTPPGLEEKLEAAVKAGCRRFDGALKGIGGCPMADDELVGNMNTERMIDYFERKGELPGLNKQALEESLKLAAEIFI